MNQFARLAPAAAAAVAAVEASGLLEECGIIDAEIRFDATATDRLSDDVIVVNCL
jgi:hypothetical protein